MLTTFAEGPHEELLDIALPGFARYAARHGYYLVVPSAKRLRDTERFGTAKVDGPRPASWLKIPLLLNLLFHSELVLWVDADIIITNHEKDIEKELPEGKEMGLVAHQADVGVVPNCGVWLLRNSARQTLSRIWAKTEFVHHGWWEQAALMSMMGVNPNRHPVSLDGMSGPVADSVHFLDPEWNVHRNDRRGVPETPRFMHATMWPDRAAKMREWASHAV